MLAILLSGLLLLTIALAVGWHGWKSRRRQSTLTRMLDLADDVERLLDRSQERMASLQSVVGRVPSDIGAVAQASLESSLPIREAKRDVLQHRLWIQKHAQTASQHELDEACAALDRVRQRLGGQLNELELAGAELASATAAAAEAAQREPAALRRHPDI